MLKNFLLSLLFIFSFSAIHANSDHYVIKQIKNSKGLSQSSVLCMLQDSEGYMWFGTSNGLNKYDGYNFTVFSHNPLDSTSISDNGINSLYEDENGSIWIGTTNGILNKFDRKNGTFTKYNIANLSDWYNIEDEKFYDYPIVFSRNNNSTITTICQDNSNNLWIGTWGKGLVKFNKETKKKSYFYHYLNDTTSLSSNKIVKILKDTHGNLWIGTFGGGLNKLEPKYTGGNENKNHLKLKFVQYSHKHNNNNSLSDNRVTAIFEDKEQNIWIGTYKGGINILTSIYNNPSSSKVSFKKIMHSEKSSSLVNNQVMAITQDNKNYVWAGTLGGGLDRINPVTYAVNHFHNKNENSLSANDIISLYSDKAGLLWIGLLLGKGINVLENNVIKFGLYQKTSDNTGLDDNIVWSVYEDNLNNLWVGTYKGGLNKLDRSKNKFYYFKHDKTNSHSISDNHVRSIIKDKYNTLWIGTYSGGLNRLNLSNSRFISYKNNPLDLSSISANQVQCLYIESDSILWVGTFGGGLNRTIISPKIKKEIKFERFHHDPGNPFSISDNRVYTIYVDNNNTMWIGTHGGGLNRFDRIEKKFYHFKSDKKDTNSISDNNVLVVKSDIHNNLLIGTYGGGLNIMNLANSTFKRFTAKDGLTSDVVYGILEDKEHNLWMSTDNGLFKYNQIKKKFTHFDIHDGLQSTEFSGGAYFKAKDGQMFFGGINGLNYFYPDSIHENNFIPPVVITSIEVLGKKIKGEKDSLKLRYNQNFITIHFSALDYTNPEDNLYEYKLVGLENRWQKANAKYRIATYTDLEPGEYIFKVRGSNNDGLWNLKGKTISLIILPPVWRTWWFILLSSLLVIIVITLLIKSRIKHLLAIEKLKTKLAADLHDNIGAGLTEISILSELTSNDLKTNHEKASERLSIISNHARSLVDGMSDIVWVINPERDSLHDLLARLKDSYNDILTENGIVFKIENLEKIKDIRLALDYKQNLYLILKEALNNAIKHSDCKKIILEINLNERNLDLVITDDGSGFNMNEITRGNGLKNLRKRANTIHGSITVDSKLGKGTKIHFVGKIRLKKKKMFL